MDREGIPVEYQLLMVSDQLRLANKMADNQLIIAIKVAKSEGNWKTEGRSTGPSGVDKSGRAIRPCRRHISSAWRWRTRHHHTQLARADIPK